MHLARHQTLTGGLIHHGLGQLGQPANALASALGSSGALGGGGGYSSRRLCRCCSRSAALGGAGRRCAGALDGRGARGLAGGGGQHHHLGGGGWLSLWGYQVRGTHHHHLTRTLCSADRLVQTAQHNDAGLPGGGSLRHRVLLLSRLIHSLLLSVLHVHIRGCLLRSGRSLVLLLLHLSCAVQHHLQVGVGRKTKALSNAARTMRGQAGTRLPMPSSKLQRQQQEAQDVNWQTHTCCMASCSSWRLVRSSFSASLQAWEGAGCEHMHAQLLGQLS